MILHIVDITDILWHFFDQNVLLKKPIKNWLHLPHLLRSELQIFLGVGVKLRIFLQIFLEVVVKLRIFLDLPHLLRSELQIFLGVVVKLRIFLQIFLGVVVKLRIFMDLPHFVILRAKVPQRFDSPKIFVKSIISQRSPLNLREIFSQRSPWPQIYVKWIFSPSPLPPNLREIQFCQRSPKGSPQIFVKSNFPKDPPKFTWN